MCGVANIDAKRFLVANAVSATIWAGGFILLGYVIGERIQDDAERFLLPITLAVIIFSFFPVFSELLRSRKRNS
jgi:membrane protein DedA with SNARE-associated domain